VGFEQERSPITGAFPSAAAGLQRYELSEEDRLRFEEEGFLSPLRVLSHEQVEELRDRLQQIGDRLDELDDLLYEVEDAWCERPHEVVLHFLGAWRVDEWFHDLIFHPGVTVPLAQLLGVERLRFWHDQVFWKPPLHPGVVPWHQDWSYWQRTTPENHITMHIALDDTDDENGCLHFVPGSHRWDPLPAASFGGDMDQALAHLDDTQRAAFQPVGVHLKAGEASIHHSSTVHGSYANRSNQPRRSVVLNFMGPDTRCADPNVPILKGCPLFDAGALIEGELFPIALDRTRP